MMATEVFTPDQAAELKRYREYVMGKAYSAGHQQELEWSIAKIEAHESFGPNEIVAAMRGLYRAAHGGFTIRFYGFHSGVAFMKVGDTITSPWGLYDLGACE
jgi:hypothetical protein